jgi:hypothetical protein
MTRSSVMKIMAVLAVSAVSPAMAQEPDTEDFELVDCYFSSDLMTGVVLKPDTAIDHAKDTLPELPTIEDDGR